MDRDGTIDMVLTICASDDDCSLAVAYNSQIPLCSTSPRQAAGPCRDPEALCVADPDFAFNFAVSPDNHVSPPCTPVAQCRLTIDQTGLYRHSNLHPHSSLHSHHQLNSLPRHSTRHSVHRRLQHRRLSRSPRPHLLIPISSRQSTRVETVRRYRLYRRRDRERAEGIQGGDGWSGGVDVDQGC